MAKETLKIMGYQVTSSGIEALSSRAHLIDAALKTEDAAYSVSLWDDSGNYVVVWGSGNNSPDTDEYGFSNIVRFPDVPYGHTFYEPIMWMATRAYVFGYSDGMFKPAEPLTRQALATIMWRMDGSPEGNTNPNFSDVPTDHVFYEAIAWIFNEEILTGYGDNTFRPDTDVTRQTFAVALWRQAGSPTGNPDPGYSDVTSSHTFYEAIAWVTDQGIMEGYSDGTFRPATDMSRQAACAAFWRQAGSQPLTQDPQYTDVSSDHPFYTAIAWGTSLGYITGYDDGTFKPADPASRQAFSAVLWREAGAPVDSPDPGFSDVTTAHVFYRPIAWVADEGILNGYEDNTFRPGDDTSRQAAAAALWRQAGSPTGNPDAGFSDVDNTHPFYEAIWYVADRGYLTGYSDNTFRPSSDLSRQAMMAALWRRAGSPEFVNSTEVTYYGKLAYVTADTSQTSGFRQEVFELPLSIPPQHETAKMRPTRFGSTDLLLISSSGGPDNAPLLYVPGDNIVTENTDTGALPSFDWPEEDATAVRPVTTYDRAGAASAVVLDSGRVLFAYSDTDYTEIKVGWAPDVTTFLTEDDSVTNVTTILSDLKYAHSALWKHPTTGEIFLFWHTRQQDGTTYHSPPECPWVVIYKTEDEGETWGLYSTIQSPNGSGDNLSWNINTGWAFGSAGSDCTVGQPIIFGERWVWPGIHYDRQTWYGQKILTPKPAIWVSDDEGLTWDKVISNVQGLAGSQNGGVCRTITEYNGEIFAAMNSSGTLNNGLRVYTSNTGDEGDWEVFSTYDYTASTIIQGPPFFTKTVNGEYTLYTSYINAGAPANSGVYDLADWEGEPLHSFGELIATYEDIDSNAYQMAAELNEEWLALISGMYVLGIPIAENTQHDGVVAYIVDKCSAEDYIGATPNY